MFGGSLSCFNRWFQSKGRIRLQHICQETLLESIFVHQLKSLLLLITLILIIIEFRGLSGKVQFIALQFQPTGAINVPKSS